MEEKVIYNFIPLERNLCIKWDEIKALLNYFDYGHPYRLAFALLATTGCRGCELIEMRIEGFSLENCTIQYPIGKNRPKMYVTRTKSYTVKIAERKIPKPLAEEIAWYIVNNKHLLVNSKLFQFEVGSLRRYLGKLRDKARKGLIKDEVLKTALLDTQGVRVAIGTSINPCYRIALHSFRRFYETFKHHVDFEKDISRLVRHMGYREKRTAMTYLYHPEMIGLDKLTNGFTVKKNLTEALFEA